MRKLVLFLTILFLSGTLFAQQLSFRFSNPRIIRLSAVDHLQFDIQVKCNTPATFLWTSQIKLNFNNTTFSNAANDWVITRVGDFGAVNSQGGFKYTLTKTVTGVAPNAVYNIGLTGDPSVQTNGPNVDDFVEIPVEWITIVKVSARLSVFTGDAIAALDFLESGMNGFQQYITGPTAFALYANPCAFDTRDFLASYTGRFYSTLYGWSQIGGSTNNVQYNNWATNVSTTVWDDASITPGAGVAGLANNLTIGNGSSTNPVLTIPASKWLTVSGTLTSPAASSLVVENGGSLIHNTALVPGTVKTVVSGSTSLTANTYHQVSVPLDGSANPVSGLFMGSYLFDFNEPTSTWNALGTPTNTPLNVDKGYLIYYPNTSNTYSFAGPLRSGAVVPDVSFTSGHGYNLLPNPYPSAIDFTLLTKSALDDALWIWNASLGNYGAYGTAVGTGTSGTSQYIPVGQAFFVKANAGGASLAMDNSVRVHNSQAFLKNGQNIENQLRLAVNGNSSSDEVIVAFDDRWSAGADVADVKKMIGSETSPQLSCVAADDSRLSIDALPFNEGDVIVPLNFTLNATSDVTFEASGMETFTVGNPIYLEDLELNTVTDLRNTPNYTFSHSAGNNLNRFQLRFMGTTFVPVDSEIPGSIFASNGYLFIDVPSFNMSDVTIRVFDALGRELSSRNMTLSGISKIPAPVAIGVYVVRVTSGNKTFVGKVFVN